MRLIVVSIALAAACIGLAGSQKSEISAKELEVSPAPVKLDKDLRQALLKALTDLEAESAEHRKDEDEKSLIMRVEKTFDEVVKKNLNKNIGMIPKTTLTFDGFPGDEEVPNEEKLQNSSFLESKKYVAAGASPAMIIEKASHDDARSYHVHNIVVPDRIELRNEPKADSLDTKSPKTSAKTSASVNKVESITLKPITQISDSLTQSASSGIASANALVAPKPTASSPTAPPPNATSSSKEKSPVEEVKIFEAPLVAAFTVQQDELGVPKSVVPIYRQSGDGQALTLQEQLEFKQRLLEKQLAELQQQQFEQTQFLVRQRQLYEQQLRQKQQFYFQEQARIRQLEEERAKIRQLEEQRLRQLEEQKIYHLQQQQQNYFPLQKQHIFEQTNVLPPQPPLEPVVHLQPSVSLELPGAGTPPLFRSYQEQPRFQQFRVPPNQQLQQQPQQQHEQQHQHQQPRLQQNFPSFSIDFQPPTVPATRFNRQEAFNAVGNFGFNNLDSKQAPPSRNAFAFNAPPKSPPSTFVYNPYVQFRSFPPPRAQTPAKQIQRLLYQSGVAGDLGNVQGPGGEDLNIVSKVLALNVGALPKNHQYIANNRKLGSSA